MIKVTILYPKQVGKRFDMDYYINVHMPLSIKLHGTALKGVSVEKAVENLPGTDVAYIAICHLLFDSVEAFHDAFMPHAKTLTEDIVNYTDIQPIIQINEVLIYK